MAEEEKTFYPFKIAVNEERRKERIEKLKAKYPLSTILKIFDLENIDDESELEQKLREALHRENMAMQEASKSDDFNREQIYKNRHQNNEKTVDDVAAFFAAEDDFLKNHSKDYFDYENRCAEIDAQDVSDTEKLAQKQALEAEYAEAIQAATKCKTLQEAKDNYSEEFDIIERNPKVVNRNLLKFYKECIAAGREDDFQEIFNDFTADKYFNAKFIKNNKGEPTNIIENEHRFSLGKDGRITHSILNLKNTDLDISWVDGKFGLAHCPENLTEAQIRALAEYCFRNGINIDDYFKLNDLKVLNEKREEIGTAASELEKNIKDLEENGGEFKESNRDGKSEDFSQMLGRTEEVAADVTEFAPSLKDLDVTRTKMVDAAKNRIGLMGFSNQDLYDISRGWNSTTISVYKTENDRLKDGETDKNGNRVHTKEFAIELIHSVPPRAKLYLEQGKEVKADHLRLALDTFKAVGCKYFIVPPAPVMGGKASMGAAMQASVKSGLVPVCKRSKKSKGCYLGEPDLVAIQEALEKEPMDIDKKVEYLILLTKELRAQEAGKLKENPNYRNSNISTSIGKFEYGAKFGRFQNTYLDNLQLFIQNGVDGKFGEKWDAVDRTAACAAMNLLIKDLQAGKLNGKPFNPLAKDSYEEMQKSMVFYMTVTKPKIVSEIEKARLANASEKTAESRADKASNDIFRKYKGDLDTTCNELKSYGVEIKPAIAETTEKYSIEKYNTQDVPLPSFSEPGKDPSGLNRLAQESKQYIREQAEIKKRGGKTSTLAEWRRKRNYEIG